jgi:hypothetical protein
VALASRCVIAALCHLHDIDGGTPRAATLRLTRCADATLRTQI